ncbi:MAG: reductive dehalogenase [Chloroflexi bacterium]|nr:reductive dehalogenase [Chloroflexota bacterium]
MVDLKTPQVAETVVSKSDKLLKNKVNFFTRRAQRPTYEVVGELERFDERDNIFARRSLKPNTPEYEAYYNLHPELREKDEDIRAYDEPQMVRTQREKHFPHNPLARALGAAVRVSDYLGDKGDGPLAPGRAEADPERMARNIKGLARYWGADMVAISTLNPAWVYSHNGRWFYQGARWGEPVNLDHRYAITLGFAHHWDMLLAGRGSSMAAAFETQHIYSLMSLIGIRLASYIRALGYPARTQHVTNYQVLQVPIAIDAGMGELGRLGFMVTKEYGPSIRLVTVTTDLPLATDAPVDIGVQDFCQRCRKCADACPTGAVPHDDKVVVRGVRKWQIDPYRCYRYWHVRGGISCYMCMSVCPWTKPRNWLHRLNAQAAARFSLARTLLIGADDLIYGRKPRLHAYPSWLRHGEEEPSLKENLSTFLHNL